MIKSSSKPFQAQYKKIKNTSQYLHANNKQTSIYQAQQTRKHIY